MRAKLHACALVLGVPRARDHAGARCHFRHRCRSLLVLLVLLPARHRTGHGAGALLIVAPRAIGRVTVASLLLLALTTLPHQPTTARESNFVPGGFQGEGEQELGELLAQLGVTWAAAGSDLRNTLPLAPAADEQQGQRAKLKL